MPRAPPRPLCLPDLVKDPQARAEYIQSHPVLYGPSAYPSPRPDPLFSSNRPSSPCSSDVHSNRTSATTLASLSTPGTPASTSTSLSVHNGSWISNVGKEASAPGPRADDPETGNQKFRASWSSAIANTKSWFRSTTATENTGKNLSVVKESNQKQIKLSPSMIAARATTTPSSSRPLSSPCPSVSGLPLLSPTGSDIFSLRTPRIGSGLRYYTERNPAPTQARAQVPDLNERLDHDKLRPVSPSPSHDSNSLTPTLATFDGLPEQPPATKPHGVLDNAGLKDEAMSGREVRGPPSPPPTPPVNVRDSDVPHIRISSGDDL